MVHSRQSVLAELGLLLLASLLSPQQDLLVALRQRLVRGVVLVQLIPSIVFLSLLQLFFKYLLNRLLIDLVFFIFEYCQ